MARYKHYDFNQLPVSLEEQLIPGTLEYAIHHVVEERLDLSIFDDRYCNDETGRKAIAPIVFQTFTPSRLQAHDSGIIKGFLQTRF
jgi:hypothetical protein